MSVTRTEVVERARQLVQDSTTGILKDATAQFGDYDRLLDQALRVFDGDVPNNRVVHYTVAAAAFRFVLYGAGAILTGLDAWVDQCSTLFAVWHPYSTTIQGQSPLDENDYRVVREPSLVVLELLTITPSAGVLRLEYQTPHSVAVSDITLSTIPVGKVDALYTITAAMIAQAAAVRAAQNTGNTSIPSDVVDRRTQDQQYRDAARILMDRYKMIVGRRDAKDLGPASTSIDLDVQSTHMYGYLWHSRGSR